MARGLRFTARLEPISACLPPQAGIRPQSSSPRGPFPLRKLQQEATGFRATPRGEPEPPPPARLRRAGRPRSAVCLAKQRWSGIAGRASPARCCTPAYPVWRVPLPKWRALRADQPRRRTRGFASMRRGELFSRTSAASRGAVRIVTICFPATGRGARQAFLGRPRLRETKQLVDPGTAIEPGSLVSVREVWAASIALSRGAGCLQRRPPLAGPGPGARGVRATPWTEWVETSLP